MNRLHHTILVIVILAIGAWLRVDDLSSREMWLDESCTWYYVHHLHDWPADGPDARLELHNLPYQWSLWLWTRLLGEDVFALRSFSALFGWLTLPVIGILGWQMGGRACGLIAMALLALHPLHIHYSEEARVYAYWLFWVSLLLLTLWNAWRTNSRVWWLAYSITAIWCVWVHYYSLFFVAPFCVVSPFLLQFFRQPKIDTPSLRSRCIVANGVILVALFAIYLGLIRPVAGRGDQAWLATMWQSYPPALSWPKSLWAMLPSGWYPPENLQRLSYAATEPITEWLPLSPRLLALLAVIVLIIWRIIRFIYSSRTPSDGVNQRMRMALALCLSWPALFIAAAVGYSWLLQPALIIARYDIPALIPTTLAIALMLSAQRLTCTNAKSKHRDSYRVGWPIVPSLVTILLLTSAGITSYRAASIPTPGVGKDWSRTITQFVSPDDYVISVGMIRWFLAYDLHHAGYAGSFASFPARHDQQIGWRNIRTERADQSDIRQEAKKRMGDMQQRLVDGHRVWVAVIGSEDSPHFSIDRILFEELSQAQLEAVDTGHPWLIEIRKPL